MDALPDRLIKYLNFFLLLILLNVGHARASETERIVDFHSQIQVFEDGHLIVVETIEVIAAGDVIKRGIYRDFPTRYQNSAGKSVRVGFEILSVLRDGRPEAYHTQSLSNGSRVYMGKKDVFISPGSHTYIFTYRTDRQLGFFDNHDELYWNVTGNDWQLPIDRARATVILPARIEALQSTAYTGLQGSKEQAFQQYFTESGNITFETTRNLEAGEGLTIAVAWPKGFVTPPTTTEKLSVAARENTSFIVALIGFIILLVYYLKTWAIVGRDPKKGTIIPRFEPPEGFSPAAVRYLHKMNFDQKSFTATVVSLAIKGALTITQDDKKYTLEKILTTDSTLLTKGEKKVLQTLFRFHNPIELGKTYQSQIKKAVGVLKKSLIADFTKAYFSKNTKHLIPGIGILLVTLAGMVLASSEPLASAGMGLWLTVWTVPCVLLGYKVFQSWRSPVTGIGDIVGRISITFFSVPVFVGEIIGLYVFPHLVSLHASLFFLGMLLLTVVFLHLLKAPTLQGRSVMDKIEGFRNYLRIADSERLKILNPPDRTPALFEKYLPYAMALDVERQWSEQFGKVLRQAEGGQGYRAKWYHGPLAGESFGAMAADLGHGLTGALASTASAPGSSSGIGSGGSSGGGGGGGGGGGW